MLLGALVETIQYRRRQRVIIEREGVVCSFVPVPGRRVRRREAACVLVPEGAGVLRNNIARRGP